MLPTCFACRRSLEHRLRFLFAWTCVHCPHTETRIYCSRCAAVHLNRNFTRTICTACRSGYDYRKAAANRVRERRDHETLSPVDVYSPW